MEIDSSQLRWIATISAFCPADVEIPRNSLFVLGSPSVVAGALLGRTVGTAIGNRRARRLAAPQWRAVGQGELSMTADRLLTQWPGSYPIHVPFRTITSWRATPKGLEIERVGWAPLRFEVNDPPSLHQWFEYLATGKTWTPPVLETHQASVAITGWCQQDPRFTFGLPENWFIGDPQWVSAVGEELTPARILAGVRRFVPPLALNLTVVEIPPNEEVTPERIEQTADECAAEMAFLSGSTFNDPIEIVNLDGERATMWHLSRRGSDPMESAYFFVSHAGHLYGGTFAVVPTPGGDGPYRQSLPELHSMLATWHWYG